MNETINEAKWIEKLQNMDDAGILRKLNTMTALKESDAVAVAEGVYSTSHFDEGLPEILDLTIAEATSRGISAGMNQTQLDARR